jgi:GNAT superfamily N-acetyltransferase
MIENQYTFKSLISCRDPSFDEFFTIYKESLPQREQKSKAQISHMITRPDYKTLLLQKNNQTIGFSILFFPGKSFCLLEYMAIDKDYRGRGLGTELFHRTFDNISFDQKNIYCLIEVDSDRSPGDLKEIKSRIQFYRRLGCLRIDGLSYILPLPSDGPPLQMDFMLYLPAGIKKPTISKHQLKHWLQLIYDKVYNCLPDDPRINQMLCSLPDPLKLA